MSKTKLWSMQFSCRRLARDARGLARTLDDQGLAEQVGRHLVTAAELLGSALERQQDARESGAGILDLAQLAFGDHAWTEAAPAPDAGMPHESPPTAEHRLVLHARNAFVSTPDLLAFLCSLRKTGVLLVDTVDERFTIELVKGEVAHAHSDGAPDQERLGNVLIELGVLTREALDRLLGGGARTRLGSLVIEQGLATRDQLLSALELQIRRLFERLFTTDAREFVFWEGPCVWGDLEMRLNGTVLLLEGARAADESRRRRESHAEAKGRDGGASPDATAPSRPPVDEQMIAGAVVAALEELEDVVRDSQRRQTTQQGDTEPAELQGPPPPP